MISNSELVMADETCFMHTTCQVIAAVIHCGLFSGPSLQVVLLLTYAVISKALGNYEKNGLVKTYCKVLSPDHLNS